MTKILFIEGVSGVGKTTLVQALQKRREYDDYVLTSRVPAHQRMNVTKRDYENVLDRIVTTRSTKQ